MGFFSEFFRQVSGGAAPKKKGQKGPARDRRAVESQIFHKLDSLVGNKYEHLRAHKTAHDITANVMKHLDGNDRDGWRFHLRRDSDEVKRVMVSMLEHGYHFKEDQALDLTHRIMDVIYKYE